MKKLSLLFTATMIVLFASCDKDDKNNPDGVEEPMTVEEHKALLSKIGVDFVNEMAKLQEEEGIGALTAFGMKLEFEDEEEWEDGRIAGSKTLVHITKSILGVTYNKISVSQFGQASYRVAQDDEPETLEDLFNENTGTFEWNADTEEFDFTDNSEDKVIFKFPSEENGTSNNATLTLSNYTSVVVSNPIDEEYEGDLPTSLDISLAVDGTTALTFGFEVDYANDGVPEQIDTELTIGNFSLVNSLTNNKQKIGSSVSFKNGSVVLIGTSFEVTGDFSDSAIEDAEDNEDPTEVVQNASFSYTLLDLKIAGQLAFADLYDEIGELDTYYDSYDEGPRPDLEGNADKIEAALAAHATLTATYVSSGAKAADVEFYTTIEDYSDEFYEEEYIELGARMVFEDGSKVDLEDFLESGFDALEDAINDLLDQIAEDIDEEIEHIDFDDLG